VNTFALFGISRVIAVGPTCEKKSSLTGQNRFQLERRGTTIDVASAVFGNTYLICTDGRPGARHYR
jgi:hypothetical protein